MSNQLLATRSPGYLSPPQRYPHPSVDEAYREADRDRKRRWRTVNKQKELDHWKAYMKVPEHREKLKCRLKSRRAVKRGQLKKKPCEVCGDVNSEKHHPDYSDFKTVVWLCKFCHTQKHVS